MNHYNGFTPQERQAAFDWLKGEIAAGRRPKVPDRPCDTCGQTRCVVYHSEDYSAPYGDNIGEFALCYVCHMMIHCRFRNPEGFAEYQRILAEGLQPPCVGFSWRTFCAKFLRAPLTERHFTEMVQRPRLTFAEVLSRGEEVQHGRAEAEPAPEG